MSKNYSSSDDMELITLVRGNDHDAFSQLADKYLWLIRAKSKLIEGGSGPEKEDLYQEGFLGLYSAAMTFIEEGEASFPTYAGLCIYRRMVSAARRHSSTGNRPLNESLSLDSEDAPTAAFEESPEALVEMRDYIESIMRSLERALSPLEKKVLNLYLSGYRRSEISKKLGISLKTFDNALQRVRSKLKNL